MFDKIPIEDFILFIEVAEATLKYVAVGYITYYVIVIFQNIHKFAVQMNRIL
jgi:hypothetical protein